MTFQGRGLTRAMGSRFAPGAFLFLARFCRARQGALHRQAEQCKDYKCDYRIKIAQLFLCVEPYYTETVTRGSPNPWHYGMPGRLRQARKAAGLSRRALEQMAGGTNGSVLYVEEGRRLPTVATAAHLAAALGVSAAWLVYGLGEPNAAGLISTTTGMGERLQSVRASLPLARAELGRRTGLSPRAIAKIEDGGQSGVDVVELLAQALGINPAWLAFHEGPQVLPSRRRGRPPAQSSAPVG